MASWWQRFPGRLEAELEAFRERGLRFELDEALFRDGGRVLLRGSIDSAGREVSLEVLYPDLFPYLRPEVYAPELHLERHQNPRDHNLCLLDRNTSFWRPSDTAAWLVADQLPFLLSLFDEGPAAMARAEAPQGEPMSAYYRSQPGAAIFVPAEMLAVPREHTVGSGRISLAVDAPPSLALRGLLCELVVKPRAGKTKRVARADEQLANRFSGRELSIRWVRLDQPPEGFEAEDVFAAADAVQPGLGQPPWHALADGELAIVGVVFPEEIRQGEYEDGWLFAIRIRRQSPAGLHEGSYLARGERLTHDDFSSRIPRLAALSETTVSLAGLGALGAPLALELARNQVAHLRLLEHDVVEAAQTVRFPFGLAAVGHAKLDVVAHFIGANHPFTTVEPFGHRLGQTALDRRGRSENEFELIARFLSGTNLLIDATAEIGIQQLLSEIARESGVTQLYVSATDGARGGQLARIVPGAGGCWHCWKRYAGEGEIPLPPREDTGTVQPRGCAAPTFTGASFDLLPVIAQAARVASATLVATETDRGSVVWVCALPEDGISPPVWTQHPLAVHPECELCSAG